MSGNRSEEGGLGGKEVGRRNRESFLEVSSERTPWDPGGRRSFGYRFPSGWGCGVKGDLPREISKEGLGRQFHVAGLSFPFRSRKTQDFYSNRNLILTV